MQLRACERLSIDPERFTTLSPGRQALYLEYEILRQQEENARAIS